MELIELTPAQLRALYHTRMKEDFPPSELKPLSAMLALLEGGHYRPFGLRDGAELAGYAMVWREPGVDFALLDYLAIHPRRRGQGLGSALLRLLDGRCRELRGVLVEAESPEQGEPAGAELRRRRLVFYRRNGFLPGGYDCRIFGVDYTVLARGTAPASREDRIAAHRAIYRSQFSPDRFSRFVHIPFPPEGP